MRTFVDLAAAGLCAVLVLGAFPAPGRGDVEQIAPGDGRIALHFDGATAVPQRYLRQTGTGALCESASWDGAVFYGEVTYCQAIGDRFWRGSYVTMDMFLGRFPILGDFIVTPPSAYRDVVTVIGPMTLHAFDVEDIPGGPPSQCNGFVRGAGSSGTGFREFLVGYICADNGPLDDARADAILQGLSIKDAFEALLP